MIERSISVAKRGLTFCMIVSLALSLLVGNGTTDAPPFMQPPPPTPWIPLVAVKKRSYFPGEEVEIIFTFKNGGSKSINLSPYPPEVKLAGYGFVRTFHQGTEKIEIEPGKEFVYILKWDQRDDNGNPVTPGYYSVEMQKIRVESPEPGRAGIYPGHVEARVLIQFPQGAMEKTVEVNASKTRNGVTVTLERVELTARGARVTALVDVHNLTPPTPGPFPEPPPDEIFQGAYLEKAWYRLDNGTERDAGFAGIMWPDKDFKLVWVIDPVPSDAREMTFVIINAGKYAGPWEFWIPLTPTSSPSLTPTLSVPGFEIAIALAGIIAVYIWAEFKRK